MFLEFREELAAQGQTSKKYTRPARGSLQRNVGLHARPYAQALGRYALFNLYMTNPNPNLPPYSIPVLKSRATKKKLQCPHYNYLYSHFPTNALKCAQLRSIALLLLLRYNARTMSLRRALILARAPTLTGRLGRGLFHSGPSSLPLLVFVDKALGVPQLLLGLPHVMLMTPALPLDKVFIAVTNLLVL